MEQIFDLTETSDAAYRLADLIKEATSRNKNIWLYEFHTALESPGEFNYQSLETFKQRSSEYYRIFLTGRYLVDDLPSHIHIALKVDDIWFIAEECGANFYLGHGPSGIIQLREVCSQKGVFAFYSEEDFNVWLKKSFKNYEKKPQTDHEKQAAEFGNLLKILSEFTTDMQRRRDTFQNLHEPQIRDTLLPMLNTHYKGKANGEAKNGKGKTDILIHTDNGQNEYIFELKKWGGIESLIEAINQLSSYMVWHNRFSGIIVFCYNNDFTSIIEKAKEHLQNTYEVVQNNFEQEMTVKIPYPTDKKRLITTHFNFVNLK